VKSEAGRSSLGRERGNLSCDPPPSLERSVYAASASARPKAFITTLVLHVVVIAWLAIKWTSSSAPVKPSAPMTVTMLPLSSPPEREETEKEKPVAERQKKVVARPPRSEPVPRTAPLLAPVVPIPAPINLPKVEPAPREAEAVTPMTVPAQPAKQALSNAPDSWEGRVLARIEKFRRYPGPARAARQQGVVYIRFRMNREGQVLSSFLARSSGFPALDQAALDTLRRADPLPKIPDDRPNELELSVPVEFYIR